LAGHGGGHVGHAGHAGHAGHVGQAGRIGHVGRSYGANYYRGFYRRNWALRNWNPIYGTYIYTDPGVPGTYYYSEVVKLYYPVDLLWVPMIGAVTVQPR
jgi:hypothetical protein